MYKIYECFKCDLTIIGKRTKACPECGKKMRLIEEFGLSERQDKKGGINAIKHCLGVCDVLEQHYGDKKLSEVRKDLLETNSKSQIGLLRMSGLSDASGLRYSTIKYYSEVGLIPYSQKGKGLRRGFDKKKALKRIKEIEKLKKKGYSVEQISKKLK